MRMGWEGLGGALRPATPFPFVVTANHHPVIFGKPSPNDSEKSRTHALKISHLTYAAWNLKNTETREHLQGNKVGFFGVGRNRNGRLLLGYSYKALRTILGDNYTNGRKYAVRCCPFEAFRKKHMGRPDFPVHMKAEIEEDGESMTKVAHSIIKDSWRDQLAQLSTSNTSSLFASLAQEDGRNPRGVTCF